VPSFLRTPPKAIPNPFIAQAQSVSEHLKEEVNATKQNSITAPILSYNLIQNKLFERGTTHVEPKPVESRPSVLSKSSNLILHPSLRKQEPAAEEQKPNELILAQVAVTEKKSTPPSDRALSLVKMAQR
jgi:hypothetical protein